MQKFTLKLTLFFALLLTARLGMAQTPTPITTVGIIGSATANGWDMSTPMTLVTPGGHDWAITLPLTASATAREVKFRANNAWAINWGGTAFPAGIGTQDGGNITVTTAGTYSVRFNDMTGAYVFTLVTATSLKARSEAALKLALAPNPARGSVKVAYDLPQAATATVTVQNLLGQTVRQLAPVRQGAGSQSQNLALEGLSSGIYLVQLRTADYAQTSRLVVE
ncbi:MAG TPA: T9SS type A sorting domain-containing protein [Hymenobacter sp.]|jgi:hypothetical protein